MLNKEPVYSLVTKRWDGSPIGEEIISKLNSIIDDNPSYYLGVQPHAFKLFTEDILNKVSDNANYCNSDIFHNKSQAGNLGPFFEQLQNRNVILVGQEYLKDLRSLFSFHHIHSSSKYWKNPNWKFMENMQQKIENQIQVTEDPVVLYSTGIPGKIILHNLYKKYGDKITQIDTGSLFEPYVGLSIRKYHKEVLKRLK